MLLGGGLGNQLFQFAAAHSMFGKENSIFDSTILQTSSDSILRAEIESFAEMAGIGFTERKRTGISSNLLRKWIGFSIIVNLKPKGYETLKIFQWAVNALSALFLSVYFREFHVFRAISDMDSVVGKNKRKSQVFAGFFQNHDWMKSAETVEFLKALSIRQPGPQLIHLRSCLKDERPIILHIRLGDYVNLNSFGVLPSKYYLDSLTLLKQKIENRTIWVFSNDVEAAKLYLSKVLNSEKVRWIGNVDDSTASTFDLMRNGYGFVIGNSTFSWWAACLARNSDAPVIAPRPWLNRPQQPRNFYLPHWEILDRDVV